MSYSPMNNVQEGKKYRILLANWTTLLRHSIKIDDERPICFKIDLDEGHFDASDRYKSYKELAADYSFLLDQLGLGTHDNQVVSSIG